MNIVVVGAGGVGGYFGGRLLEADLDVTFLLRGKTLDAIKNKGLRVKSIDGDFWVKPKVVDNTNDLGAPDIIILAVKSWQIEDVAQSLKRVISSKTMVIPLQNGANNVEKLSAIIDPANIISAFCKIISKIESPGIINHMGASPELVIGELNNIKTERILKLKQLLDKANFKTSIPENIHLEVWKKFLFIATISGLGGLTRANLGAMRSDEHLRDLMSKTADEIIAIAQMKKIPLLQEHKYLIFKFIDNLKPETTASMQRDIMAGRPSELYDFNGYIVDQGRKLGVKTPINYFIYHCLLPMEKKARR